MQILQLILTVVVLGWSLYSAVAYWSRRGDNKSALKSLQNDATPLRSLTAEESAALAPFLFDPAKPSRPMPLQRDGVFALHGEYVRHGLHTSQGGETLHDTIGGVEVLLPYDARDFLDTNNSAEVVFTDKFALVVGLNGTFELLGGRTRALRRQQQDQQWRTGKTGDVQDVEPTEVLAVDTKDADAVRDALRVEMLGQRDETPAEVESRAGDGRGWLAAAAWALALLVVFIGSSAAADQRLFWLGPAGVLAALAAWFTWGPRTAPAPGKVNRVRGHVAAIAMATPGGAVGPLRWFVGDKVPVVMPAHWQARWSLPPEAPMDVEVRVADHTAVRFGKALSVHDEVTRFRPIRWGRHLVLALTATVVLAGLGLWGADDLPSDVILTAAWLRGTQPQSADSPEALAKTDAGVGTWLHLSGRAACHWAAAPGGEAARVDCTKLRWVPASSAMAPVAVDDLTRELMDGDFLKARGNVGLDLLLQLQMQMQMAGNTDPLARYQAMANAPKVVTGVAELIRVVNTACANASPACDQLKADLAEGLQTDADDAPITWAAWTQRAASGQLTGDDDTAVMRGAVASSVQAAGRRVGEDRAAALIDQALAARHAAAPATALLHVLPGEATRLPTAPEEMDAVTFLEQMNEDVSGSSGEPFEVSGLVVDRSEGPGGTPVWHLDALRSLNDPWPAVMRTGALALALLLAGGHGLAFAVRLAQARRRSREVNAFIDQRMPAEGFGV